MSTTFAQPWTRLPLAAARAVHGVLTDIDDTLTTAGAITPDALQALADLRAAGVPVIAITGRPMGWSAPFAAAWPVDAIVVAARVLREVPGATLAQDSAGRVTDIAVDHAEFAHLAPAQIEQVVALMRSEGMSASVSSIHINGWFGEHDKLSGARWIVRRLFNRDIDAELPHWVYVGDSTNDQAMFGHFPLSVGVANLLQFENVLSVWPAYITEGERGSGFAEVARTLLPARE